MLKFKKIFAVIPEELYRKLAEYNIFKGDFDGLICDLLIEYLDGMDRLDENSNRR
jgi:hypothetical protein